MSLSPLSSSARKNLCVDLRTIWHFVEYGYNKLLTLEITVGKWFNPVFVITALIDRRSISDYNRDRGPSDPICGVEPVEFRDPPFNCALSSLILFSTRALV